MVAQVFGVVQGVGFRYAAVRQARALRLRGYVRNATDGSVEVVAEGREEDLRRLLAWLGSGPTHAQVIRVEHRYGVSTGRYAGFDVAF